MNRVYVSLPTSGPSAAAGREVLLGVELAHVQRGSSVELVTLDSFAADRDERALSNARRAAERRRGTRLHRGLPLLAGGRNREALHELDPGLWLVGTDGVAVPQLAHELSAAAAARTRLFVANRAPLAFYGFEAMALALDAIGDGSGDRETVVRAARATRDRESALGTYSLDENGLTTTADYGRLVIVGHQIVRDVA